MRCTLTIKSAKVHGTPRSVFFTFTFGPASEACCAGFRSACGGVLLLTGSAAMRLLCLCFCLCFSLCFLLRFFLSFLCVFLREKKNSLQFFVFIHLSILMSSFFLSIFLSVFYFLFFIIIHLSILMCVGGFLCIDLLLVYRDLVPVFLLIYLSIYLSTVYLQ